MTKDELGKIALLVGRGVYRRLPAGLTAEQTMAIAAAIGEAQREVFEKAWPEAFTE